jgi:molecular chaperone GrpE
MTDKKEPRHNEELVEPAKQAVETPEDSGGAEAQLPQETTLKPDELQELSQKLADAEAKSAENLDGWQRTLAEFQNYKKRIEREREADQAARKGDLLRKVLPILDDLQRALQNRPTQDAWTDGIELIERKLEAILEAEGLTRIEAEGALFDPNFHEAISNEPVDGAESGRIVGVVQNGYMLGDRVIRPAQVRVAK